MKRPAVALLALVALMTASAPPRASAQDPAAPKEAAPTAPAPAAEKFAADQLDQMVGPIALYPDPLVAQILMAATYPLEIVQAGRWLEKNKGLTGAKLEEALKKEDWDVSVKALCTFPDVLKRMSEGLDWTQDLGDAFLGQKSEVMDAVQRMRSKAHEAGNLKSTEQQKVVVKEDKIIVIEPTNPEVIYVPTYYPSVVYGAAYPAPYYPAYYYPAPYAAPLFSFAVGVAVGAAVWGNCNWGGGWGGGDVDIDIDTQNNFNKNTNVNSDRSGNKAGDKAGNRSGDKAGNKAGNKGKSSFKHDPSHRKGVNYKNSATAKQYGGSGASNRVSKDQARGKGGGSQPSAGTRPAGGGNKPSAGTRPAGGGNKPSSGTRPSSTQSRGGGDSAVSKRGSAGSERSASSRGASSTGRSGTSRSGGGSSGGASRSGGGSRSGGSRSGGGGGRGGGGRR